MVCRLQSTTAMRSPDEKFHWRHTVQAMFVEAFPPAAHRGLAERLAAAGIDVSAPLLPAYGEPVFQAQPGAHWRAAAVGHVPCKWK